MLRPTKRTGRLTLSTQVILALVLGARPLRLHDLGA